jgi:nicotinic acid mononucleotide adenylyltransferase
MSDQKPSQKQEGGFMMGDKGKLGGPETLYSIMFKHFNKPGNKTFFDSVLKQTDKAPDIKDLSFLNTSDYKEIYTNLINIIMTDEVYTQTFSDGGKPFFKQVGMHNYHIQLCALMTMSFLIELELFSVVHNYIRINIGTNATNNILPSTFAHSKHATTTPLRCYKPLIQNGIEEMLNYFTQSLDGLFDRFMNFLVDEIYTRINLGKIIFSTKEELIEKIVPVKSTDPLHAHNTFDYIYVNWKDRIRIKIQEKMDPATYTAGKYPRRINSAIERALYQVEEGGSRYIAEGTGFFSFLYLFAAVEGVVYNGSCITYSMLELYIMARLHVNADNLFLEMESAHPLREHGYWKSVQGDKKINLRSVTHWTTKYNFQSKPLHFRHVFTDSIKPPSGKPSFNFVDPDKPNLCLLLLYPIFDSYIRYIDQPEVWPKQENQHINKIIPFIRERIEFVKTLFTTRKTVSKHVSEHRIRGRTEVKVSVATIRQTWFSEVFGFDETSFVSQKGSFNVKKNPKPTESEHILMTVKGTEIDIGVFRYMSVEDLLKTATSNPSAMSVFGFDQKNLKYFTMTSPAHVVHMTPGYSGSIFQVASQFNALEMASPELTPQQGITNYWNDKTQGPACAMVCPLGTLYRNYFCMPDTGNPLEDKSVNGNPQTGTPAGGKGTGNNQINTLTDLEKVDKCFENLTFRNGYIFVNDKAQLDAINKYLSTPDNFWKAMMAIKYVIQEDTPVVDVTTSGGKILDQIVSQIYCSAYPVAYSTSGTTNVPDTSAADYALLSSMILHAVYYSTLAYAVTRITPDETRKKVFLTKVGGGVFGNDVSLIDNAIYNALRHFTAYPIDVYIVDYKNPTTIIDPEEVKSLTSAPSRYPDIQTALKKRATDETETLKKATDEKVAADKVAAEKEKAEKAAAVEKAEKKHLKLKDAINQAIKNFSDKLKVPGADADDAKYAGILDELSDKIGNVRTKIDATLVVKSKTGKKTKGKGKKLEPKPGSEQMPKDEVTNFIKEHEKDAIFVVTGGSFNPPHNGHIGMFQKAYDALTKERKITMDDGKKVYGVMVPASDSWIEGKLCKEEHKKPDKCTDVELADAKSMAAIKSKRIKVVERVNLCKLSCDSYEWPDSANFNASNMIVVNESAQGEEFTKKSNTYYLCGSDYYEGVEGTNFICVLRKGDTKKGTDLVKKDGKLVPIKKTDIIIENDGEDNDASSTLLRNMLTEIGKLDPTVPDDMSKLPTRKTLLDLISIPVLRRLLDLKYILTDTENNKKTLAFIGIDLDEEDDKVERAKNMDKVGENIELNVDIGSDTIDKAATVTKKFNRIETGGGGDCLFHTLRYLLTSAKKIKPTGDKTVDMMKIRNDIVDHVKTLGNTFVHLKQVIGDRLDFEKSNEGPDRAPLHLGDEPAKKDINVDGGVRTDGNMVLFSDRVVIVKDVPAKAGVGDVMKYVSQDMTRNYFTVMKEQGTFGTDFELGIAAALYDIPICLITNAGRCQYYIFDKSNREVRGLEASEYAKIKNNIRYIYNYTRIHYQYLECTDKC